MPSADLARHAMQLAREAPFAARIGAAAYVILSAAGQLLLRAGAAIPAAVRGQAIPSPLTCAGLACWVLATFAWMSVLARAPLLRVYPVAAATYLVVPLGARLVLGETLTTRHLTGMALIALGIALCAHANGGESHVHP